MRQTAMNVVIARRIRLSPVIAMVAPAVSHMGRGRNEENHNQEKKCPCDSSIANDSHVLPPTSGQDDISPLSPLSQTTNWLGCSGSQLSVYRNAV
jgi:hypothetical protein